MSDEEMEFYERLLYVKDCIIDGLQTGNEILREKIKKLEEEIEELERREECEIMRSEER